jgi:hypothetical protein
MKFAMLICGDDTNWANLSPDEEQDAMKGIYAWFERWQPTGKVAEGGVELQDRTTAKTVRQGPDGEPVVTDGPYLELKEVIGSVLILDCETIDEAVEMASTWPMAAGMSALEIRPIMVRE